MALPSYTLVGSYAAPAGVFDVLPDGRLITITATGQILAQSAINAGDYIAVGSIDASPLASFGPSFISVSPSGSRIAIGDGEFATGGEEVLFLETASLSNSGHSPVLRIAGANYMADWRDDDTLYASGADFSGNAVLEYDLTTATSRIVIENAGDGSGGVAIRDGRLFTASGFAFSPGAPGTPDVGEVRAIALADIDASALPIDFALGIPVADALSGSPIGFDALGNMLIGGGDFDTGDFGYAAIIDALAISGALAGSGTAPDSDELRVSPITSSDFYSVAYNPVTQEVLVTAFGSPLIYRYAIPAPGIGAAAMIFAASAAHRRRRHAKR